MLKIFLLLAASMMAMVADARYVYNSYLRDWVRAGDGSSIATPKFTAVANGTDYIGQVHLCVHARFNSIRSVKITVRREFSNAVTNITIPSHMKDDNVLNRCLMLLDTVAWDCITDVTQGYHLGNRTYTFLQLRTSLGKVGTYGRRDNSTGSNAQVFKSLFAKQKT